MGMGRVGLAAAGASWAQLYCSTAAQHQEVAPQPGFSRHTCVEYKLHVWNKCAVCIGSVQWRSSVSQCAVESSVEECRHVPACPTLSTRSTAASSGAAHWPPASSRPPPAPHLTCTPSSSSSRSTAARSSGPRWFCCSSARTASTGSSASAGPSTRRMPAHTRGLCLSPHSTACRHPSCQVCRSPHSPACQRHSCLPNCSTAGWAGSVTLTHSCHGAPSVQQRGVAAAVVCGALCQHSAAHQPGQDVCARPTVGHGLKAAAGPSVGAGEGGQSRVFWCGKRARTHGRLLCCCCCEIKRKRPSVKMAHEHQQQQSRALSGDWANGGS